MKKMDQKKKDAVKDNVDESKIIEKVVDELFSLIGIKAEKNINKEEDAYVIEISSESETGLLIGRKGENLNALQHIINLIVRQKTGDWKKVVINIGDWRQKQEDYLRNLALHAAQRARETNTPQNLYNLTPAQRRTIHLILSEEEGVVSESFGEGNERYLTIKTK